MHPFERFGVMIDCSRNAVMTPSHIKQWLPMLAKLGYNTLLLYTEDTYQLPDEPFFGYLRGGYCAEEIRDLDDAAHGLGIELVGCIQTLGHLEHLLKWSPYWEIKDTPSVLMVDDDRSYALLEKMIAFWGTHLRSRRLHIGMDETHDLGRGRFMDRHGYQRGYDLFQRHLTRVMEICDRQSLRPMLWSDMVFRMGNPTQNYYDPATVIPADVQAAMPKQAQWVYWDYYHEDAAFYTDWIQRHRDLGVEPVMAAGVWTWGGHFWYAHEPTRRALPACIAACKASGVKEIFFTLWGDDGAYVELDSALAGLAYAAALARGHDAAGAADLFREAVGVDYAPVIALALLQNEFNPGSLFWDDPLLGIFWKNEIARDAGCWRKALRAYQRVLPTLPNGTEPIDFDHGRTLFGYLQAVIAFRLKLDKAYAARDLPSLQRLMRAARRMPKQLEACHQTFRRQWLRRNRPQGLETIQNRIGARKQRWLELAQRLEELVSGHLTHIPELDEKPATPVTLYTRWRDVCASGIP
jgi:hypothetical protein